MRALFCPAYSCFGLRFLLFGGSAKNQKTVGQRNAIEPASRIVLWQSASRPACLHLSEEKPCYFILDHKIACFRTGFW